MTYKLGNDIPAPVGYEYYQDLKEFAKGGDISKNNFFAKALTSGTAASGSEFIPSPTSAKIIDFVFEKSWARQTFQTWTMDSITLDVPKFDDTYEVDHLSAEITDPLNTAVPITEGTLATSNVTLTLKTLATNMQVQEKWLAYNISPQAEQYVRNQIQKRMVEVEEDAIVNGDTDTSSSNINNAYNSTDHPHGYGATNNEWLIVFNGLRNSATGTIVNGGSDAISTADFRAALKNLGKYGTDPKEVIWIVSTDMRTAIIGFEQFETMEKYPNATIISGQVGLLYGSAVVVTNKMPNTQDDTLTNAGGIRSSSTATNSYTEALAVYRDSPMIGVPSRMDRTFRIVRKPFEQFDRVHFFAIEDIAFNLAYPDAVVRIYNVTA